MMEADLKAQAAIAIGSLRDVSLANSAVDYIDAALRTIQETISAIPPQGQPHAAAELLTPTHMLSLAMREVAELEMSVGAAIIVVSRWLNPKVGGLQGLPASAWRVRSDEVVRAVTTAGNLLETAGMHWHSASAVLDIVIASWLQTPNSICEAWVRDASSSLNSARDCLNDARNNIIKTRLAAMGARDAGKIIIDLL